LHWWKKGISSVLIFLNKLDVLVSDEVLAERKANWKPVVKEVSGYLKRYRELVTSGNRGAVLEVPSKNQ